MQKQISLHNLIDAKRFNPITKVLVSAIDFMLGIRKMNRLYHQYKMQGLSKGAFADRLLEILNIRVEGEEALARGAVEGAVYLHIVFCLN